MTNDPPHSKKRILIVDDDPSIRHMLRRILIDEGYDTEAAANGREGLNIAQKNAVDLVLLDLKMPGMTGQETLAQLAASHPGLPVIIISAFTRAESPLAFASGRPWLQKPLDFPALLELIKRLAAQPAVGK
jgi:CheY-like chemotaxis protein